MMLHNIWILCSIVLIFLIILQNPKSQAISNQNKLFGSTRAAEDTTSKVTWVFVAMFFTLTIIISSTK